MTSEVAEYAFMYGYRAAAKYYGRPISTIYRILDQAKKPKCFTDLDLSAIAQGDRTADTNEIRSLAAEALESRNTIRIMRRGLYCSKKDRPVSDAYASSLRS